VSLVGTDDAPHFDWCRPSIAHIRWDRKPVVRRVMRWVPHISQDKNDIRQPLTHAEFIPRGTIGPAKKEEYPTANKEYPIFKEAGVIAVVFLTTNLLGRRRTSQKPLST
jgi:hypothetical protein